ncbi:hypothetical protein K466DRAFT_599241 [Polyporus arcularius HHB13444]|uniref:Uncharacterized protein n=1 Tax=Polyporus arcularius HHB13444 TaxID=1314778 RepID=A0A5C3PHM6_9APHY|nr:hypothetical protein K466DRAFT_599241 [Polyporus arcularius HHB13444]
MSSHPHSLAPKPSDVESLHMHHTDSSSRSLSPPVSSSASPGVPYPTLITAGITSNASQSTGSPIAHKRRRTNSQETRASATADDLEVPNLIRSVDSSLSAILVHCQAAHQGVQAVNQTVHVVNHHLTTEIALGTRLNAVEAELAALKTLLRQSLVAQLHSGTSCVPSYELCVSRGTSPPPAPSIPLPMRPATPSALPSPLREGSGPIRDAHAPLGDVHIPTQPGTVLAPAPCDASPFTMSKARWDTSIEEAHLARGTNSHEHEAARRPQAPRDVQDRAGPCDPLTSSKPSWYDTFGLWGPLRNGKYDVRPPSPARLTC